MECCCRGDSVAMVDGWSCSSRAIAIVPRECEGCCPSCCRGCEGDGLAGGRGQRSEGEVGNKRLRRYAYACGAGLADAVCIMRCRRHTVQTLHRENCSVAGATNSPGAAVRRPCEAVGFSAARCWRVACYWLGCRGTWTPYLDFP